MTLYTVGFKRSDTTVHFSRERDTHNTDLSFARARRCALSRARETAITCTKGIVDAWRVIDRKQRVEGAKLDAVSVLFVSLVIDMVAESFPQGLCGLSLSPSLIAGEFELTQTVLARAGLFAYSPATQNPHDDQGAWLR